MQGESQDKGRIAKMKAFFKKHTWVFVVIIAFVALLTNFSIGFFQDKYTTKLSGYYLVDAVCKWITAALVFVLMLKWGYVKKGKNYYMKAAVVSSLVFGCLHFSWTIRDILIMKSFSLSNFLGNCHQVFYTFCFGMLAAGITLYTRSLIPAIFWHSLVSISAFLHTGLMQQTTYLYYYRNNLLSLKNVFDKYGILPGVAHGEMIVRVATDIIILIAGIVVVKNAEKKLQIDMR